ncbi:renin receptor-like isoform X2 [Stylophora pistillata]|uniref:renin receptor-like isoform X2 n=1 Tax=Stylophora pistillata TaxID=50429 RepID=UPI000C04FBE2|nr:renin receptor-like isoform X2 [Stylophora pistillata]
MATKPIVLCLFHFFFVSAVTGLLKNGADSLIIREPGKKSDSSKLIIAYTPNYVTFLPNAGTIPSNEISDVIALAMGFSATKELSWGGLLAGDVFRRPKANVLITVDGVTKDDNFDLPGRAASYPVAESEGVVSLAGILSTSRATHENLPTRVANVFGGKSLTVSMSGSEVLAAAGHTPGTNSYTSFWNQAEDKFALAEENTVISLKDLLVTKDEIIKRLKRADFGVKFSPSTKEFTVSVPRKGNAVFNMEKKEDFLLFAEVDVILQILEKLSSDPNLVQDGVPDVFTLGLSSVKGLRRRYGDKSLQAEGAVQFLKEIIPQIVKKFSDLYNGNVLVEVLSLEWLGDLQTRYPREVHVVYQEVQPHLVSQSRDLFHDQLPSVTLRHDLEEQAKQSLCASLHNKLLSTQSPLKVYCNGKPRLRRSVDSDSQYQAGSNIDLGKVNLAPEYSKDYPIIFNISLWLLVVLVLSLYVVCLVMWYMDPGRDSIIYRMTSQRIKME